MKKLRVAILGCGSIAGGYDERMSGDSVWTHAKAYQQTGEVEMVAAFDPDKRRLDEFCRAWGIAGQAENADSLLSEFRPDILSICGPNETHFPSLKNALDGGSVKAILCEKPLTLSLKEAETILESCRKKKVILAVNYLRRWDELLSLVGKDLKSGKYGRPVSARALYTKGVFHNASHAINLFTDWFGPVLGAQMAKSYGENKGDLLADFSLDFKSGVGASFHACRSDNFNIFELEVFTEQARLRFPGGAGLELQIRIPSPLQPGEFSLGPVRAEGATVSRSMLNVVKNLVGVLNGREELRMPAADAVSTIAACELVKAAAAKAGRDA